MTLLARAYPYLVVAPFAFLPFLPVGFNAVFITTVGIALGGVLCLLAGVASPRSALPRPVFWALALSVLSASWFALSALWAANPRLALYSPRASAVWVLLAVWLVAGVLIATPRTLRETLAATAAAGSFIGVAAMAEVLSGNYVRAQGYAAGYLENSTSSGILLAVASVACVVGFLVSKPAWQRVAFAGAGALCGVALLMSSSRAALLALLALIVFTLALAFVPVPRRRWWLFGAVSVGGGFAVTGLALAAALGGLGPGALDLIARVGTDRDAIWRSAWAQFVRSPLIGEGIGQFSATIQAGLSAIPTVTYDTHNTLISAGLGGGILGLLVVLAALYALVHAAVVAALSGGRSKPALMLGALPVFLLVAGLFAWVDSAALLVVSALIGAFLGSYAHGKDGRDEASISLPVLVRSAALVAGIGALAIVLIDLGPVGLLYQYGGTQRVQTPPTLEEALALRQRLPEARASLYLLGVLKYQLGIKAVDDQRAYEVLQLVRPDAEVDVTVASRAAALAMTLGDSTDPDGFALVREFALAGAQADPASGQWYTMLAYDAQRRGMASTAASFARKALSFPQDDATRAKLSAIAQQ